MLYFFAKVCLSDLVLLMIWSGKGHALIHFQRAGAYEKRDMGLSLKAEYSRTSVARTPLGL